MIRHLCIDAEVQVAYTVFVDHLNLIVGYVQKKVRLKIFLRPVTIKSLVSFILAVLRENLILAHACKKTQINKYSACPV